MADSVSVGSSQVLAAAERGMLIFPSKTGSEERSLTGKSKNQLKEMCREYKLAVGGNKPELVDRLREFSEKFCNDPAACKPVKRRKHKGPREGPSKNKRTKLSATRRAAIIDTERITERSKDTRTEDEINDLISWAVRTVARCPYEPPTPASNETVAINAEQSAQGLIHTVDKRIQILESQLAALGAASDCPDTSMNWTFAGSTETAYSPLPMEFMVREHSAQSTGAYHPAYDDTLMVDLHSTNIDWSYTATPQHLHINAMATSPTPLTGFAASTRSVTCTPASATRYSAPVTFARSSDPTPSAPAVSTTSRPSATHAFELGNGVIVHLTTDKLNKLSVPATSFAQDIDRLNEMWDDTSHHWKGDSIFQVDGRSIALVHFPKFFKQTDHWSAHKSNWTEWKFLVERYRQGTPEEFWKEFKAADGGKMSYTAILKHLRDARKGSDAELAVRARLEYGANFETTFRYRSSKTKEMVVMTKATAIAKLYRSLHSLA